MNIITLDMETYYSKEYSLSKITTEQYIRSSEFEVIGVAVKVNDEPAVWFSGTEEETAEFLRSFDYDSSLVVAHNSMFDMAILSWRFGIRPKRIADTLSMARALVGVDVGGSLAALAKWYELGEKGTEVLQAIGKHREDFTPAELAQYGEYCKNDTDLTYKLFLKLSAGFPLLELRLIDLTLRMFTEPVLELDVAALRHHLEEVQQHKQKLMSKVMADPKQITSNDKLAAVLLALNVTPPTKISPTTGKEAYAFAKTDEEFKALLEHDDERVQAVVAARLGVKSTLAETRTQRMLDIAARGVLPIPLRYYAAHTGRWGGSEKINMQNLPRGSALKRTVLAPKGYVFVDCDSSQIEARVLAWLSEQNDLVDAFEAGEDVYKIMASAIYNKPTTGISKDERFVGKTTVLGCIGAGTLVLCDSGWKPIELVSLSDKLWDGEEWVCHQGLLNKGIKQTLNLCGTWLTPDHKVLCGTQWLETQSVVVDESTLSLALGTGAANLPSQAMCKAQGWGSKPSSCGVTVIKPNTPSTNRISRTLGALGALFAQKKLLAPNGIGSTPKLWLTTPTARGCLTGCPLPLPVAIAPTLISTPAMGEGVSTYMKNGAPTGLSFSNTLKRLMGGITLNLKSTASTTTKGTNPATYALQPEAKTCLTSAGSKNSSKKLMTYDLAYAGPRNRYTILTERGPIVVHNCGYGMGGAKFQAQLKNFGVELPDDECKRIIEVYRETYPNIPILWRQAGAALDAMLKDCTSPLGRDGVLVVDGAKGIRLPNGMYIKYPNLRKVVVDGRAQYMYDTRKGKAIVTTKVYGGKVIENVCQALARIAIGEQMLLVSKKYKVVMTVHDAIGCIIPEKEATTGQEFVEICMRIRPEWAPDLPLNCESGVGKSYGDC